MNFIFGGLIMKKAFTMAEVLITLGIIGIVAAVTMPVLVAKYQNKQNTVILRKNWSILSQTFLFADNNGAISQIENWSQGDLAAMKSWFNNYINPYLKITSVCYEKWGCWNKNVLYMNGSKFRNDVGCGHNSLSFILNNGSYICLDDYDKNSVDSRFGVSGVKTPMTMVVYIDVNGDRQPNILGKDVFVGVYSDGKLIPSGNSRTDNEINTDCSESGYGYFCTKKFFMNNMELPVVSD